MSTKIVVRTSCPKLITKLQDYVYSAKPVQLLGKECRAVEYDIDQTRDESNATFTLYAMERIMYAQPSQYIPAPDLAKLADSEHRIEAQHFLDELNQRFTCIMALDQQQANLMKSVTELKANAFVQSASVYGYVIYHPATHQQVSKVALHVTHGGSKFYLYDKHDQIIPTN